MKNLLNIILLLVLLQSCTESEFSGPYIETQYIDITVSSNIDFDETDCRDFIKEGDLHFDLFLTNQDIIKEMNEKIENEFNSDNLDYRIDEINFREFISQNSSISLSPLFYEAAWEPFLEKIEVLFIPKNGDSEIVMGKDGEKLSDQYTYFINTTDENTLDDVINSEGDFVYRFSFNSMPQEKLRIVWAPAKFRGVYDVHIFN